MDDVRWGRRSHLVVVLATAWVVDAIGDEVF